MSGPSTTSAGGDGVAGATSSTGGAGGQGGTAGNGIGGLGGLGGLGGVAGAGGIGGVGGLGGMGGVGGMGGGQNTPCTLMGAPCAMGLYCESNDCMSGTCQPVRPPSGQQRQDAPVCGCDGISYFNFTIAESFGMSIRHTGPCTSMEAVACTRTMTPCAPGLHCNTQVANANACFSMTDPAGTCWGVPIACDTNEPQARGCIGSMCADRCSLIQSHNPWYEDMQCP